MSMSAMTALLDDFNDDLNGYDVYDAAETADFPKENPPDFPDPIPEAARELFGISYLFPYQRLVIANILEAASASGAKILWSPSITQGAGSGLVEQSEQDGISAQDDRSSLGRQIVILPTGAGKSLCFQLPAMLLDGPTLVIYPILSLMSDQERRLAERNFAPVTLRGGQSREEREEIFRKLRERESRFIIANPEVLLTSAVLERLPELGIIHAVIDESHCVSEWGESFRPAYLEIGKIIEASLAPVVTAFTATASAPVLEKIDKYIFGGGGAHRITGNPNRANICYHAIGTLLRDKTCAELLAAYERPAIVFCSSRPGTEKLARFLRMELNDKEIKFYHAGLTRAEKSAVEQWFFASEKGILTATCAYGMGVDKPNIRTVIHRDCPPSVEAYLQESGRAGRDGGASRAFFLWGPEDERTLRRAKTDADKKRVSDLLAFGQSDASCRRDTLLDLLNYTGERTKSETGCCDVCEGSAIHGIIEEAPILEFFRRNNRAWTPLEAARLFCNSPDCNWTEDEARYALREIIRTKKLAVSKNLLWKGKVVRASR